MAISSGTDEEKQALIALADEKETLSLAIEGGMTYAWRLDKGCFVFEDAFWASQGLNPRQLSFKEFMSFIHPDHWEGVKFNWRNLKSAHKKLCRSFVTSTVKAIVVGVSLYY